MLIIIFAGSVMHCTVKYTYLKAGYEDKNKFDIKRIALAIEPATDTSKSVRKLIIVLQREFVSVQRNYILLPLPDVKKSNPAVKDYCSMDRRLNGILFSRIRSLKKENGSVQLGLQTTLYNCAEEKIWESYGENKYKSNDEGLKTLIDSYSNRLGPDIRFLAAPAYLLVRALLTRMPDPELTEAEKLEKIDLME